MATPKDPLSSSDLLRTIFASKTDARIQRLSKILSTPSGLDSTLTLVGYGFFLISSQLQALEKLELKTFTPLFASNASETALKAGIASVPTLADLVASTKAVAGMCSDFRTFTRLWGLLGVYAMAKKQYLDPPKDAVLKALSLAQTLSLGGYYVYENGYYLAGKGVLRGWKPEKITKWAKTSMRLFFMFVLLEFVRLWRARQLREERKARVDGDEKSRADIEKEEEVWWRSSMTNLAYIPLSAHWASEKGIITDGVVGLLMSFVGVVKVRAAWAATTL
jgi:hypothetical protein